MPTRRKPCKFFANGGCLKGENCNFSHDGDSPQKNICNFYRKGACLYGSHCKYEHGKASLEQQASSSSAIPNQYLVVKEEHLKACQEKEKQFDALKLGEEIECSVCLEHVLKKSKEAERKFGILSECDHPFCISCIRNWRSSTPAPGMDVNTAQKTCPICRKVSYFVIPSVTWYSTKEEKQEIIDNYKAKLKSIDCKHFKFGNGHCPFGAGCFYKHTVKPGSYTWVHHRPPPRSPRQRRSNFDDMDGMIEIFGNLMTLDDLLDVDLENNPEDLQFAGLEPWQWEFFWSQLGYDTSDDEIDYAL